MSNLHNMRIVEIPKFRAVTSGAHTLNELFNPESPFLQWVNNHKNLLRQHIFEPSDFLWHENCSIDTSVWIHAIKDCVTAEDTYPYEIIEFPDGIFLIATGDEKNSDDLNETVDCMMTWIRSSDVFEYGDFPPSGMCNMPNPDGKADRTLGIAQQQIFLPLKLRNK